MDRGDREGERNAPGYGYSALEQATQAHVSGPDKYRYP
jgi:hypothetical protein